MIATSLFKFSILLVQIGERTMQTEIVNGFMNRRQTSALSYVNSVLLCRAGQRSSSVNYEQYEMKKKATFLTIWSIMAAGGSWDGCFLNWTIHKWQILKSSNTKNDEKLTQLFYQNVVTGLYLTSALKKKSFPSYIVCISTTLTYYMLGFTRQLINYHARPKPRNLSSAVQQESREITDTNHPISTTKTGCGTNKYNLIVIIWFVVNVAVIFDYIVLETMKEVANYRNKHFVGRF